jgi:hypothetical protein
VLGTLGKQQNLCVSMGFFGFSSSSFRFIEN